MDIIAVYTILSVLAISLISFFGAVALAIHTSLGKSAMHFLVSFAAGALLGDVFIHLLPELAEEGVVIDTKPLERAKDVLLVLFLGADLVRILDTEEILAAVLLCEKIAE